MYEIGSPQERQLLFETARHFSAFYVGTYNLLKSYVPTYIYIKFKPKPKTEKQTMGPGCIISAYLAASEGQQHRCIVGVIR